MSVSPPPVGRRTFLVSLGAVAAVGCAVDVPKLASADDFGTTSPEGGDSGSHDADSGAGGDSGDSAGWEAECEAGFEELAACERTPHAGEGPYFVDGVEERTFTDIRGTDGQKMVVDLRVYEQSDDSCTPIEGARVEIWHCDEEGVYDMSGDNHCRARQNSATDGTVCFQVLRPPAYGDGENMLPEHLHLNVFIDGDKVLTTQIQFEDDPVVLENPPPVPELILPVETLASGLQKVRLDLIFNRDFPPNGDPPDAPPP
jgi:protocatechuate 3,4-dioxygenase beta subunit